MTTGVSKLLPFGHTLHYPGCRCPGAWVPGARACDVVDSFVQQAFLGVQQGLVAPLRKLRVLFCLPHHNLTGGMKMLLEQIRLLRQRGHHVAAVTRSDTAKGALPPWTDVTADEEVVCRLTQSMAEVCDVHSVAEWLLVSPAPVLYWEQGHEFLFGDPVRVQELHSYRQQDQLFHRALHLPVALASVSEAVQQILEQEFGRTSLLIHNGIDCQSFFPGPRAPIPPTRVFTAPNYQDPGVPSRPSVLLVGNPMLPLKGFDVAIAVLSLVNQTCPIEVTWICQSEPTERLVPGLQASGLRINLHVSPSQAALPALYRGHDCFLFASRYEAWGMPVMEAMASGLACVTTGCLGVTAFARPGVNCFMASPQDVLGLARAVLVVLGQPLVRERLQAMARQTAKLFSPDTVASQMESVLYSLASCSSELLFLRQVAAPDIQLTFAWAAQACTWVPEQQRLLQQQGQGQQGQQGQQQGQQHAQAQDQRAAVLAEPSGQLQDVRSGQQGQAAGLGVPNSVGEPASHSGDRDPGTPNQAPGRPAGQCPLAP